MADHWTLPPMQPIPEVHLWARVMLWPFLLVAALAFIPFGLALLPLAGLMWLGAKR